ncbi:hypothetical protein COOONC_26791 [Cooperia oncophora]
MRQRSYGTTPRRTELWTTRGKPRALRVLLNQYLEGRRGCKKGGTQLCATASSERKQNGRQSTLAECSNLAMLQCDTTRASRTPDDDILPFNAGPFHVTYTMPSYLPRLEIPKFSGRRADWDNFWAIFSANIHEQNISPMLKFNYCGHVSV